jgi:hypothetical protein
MKTLLPLLCSIINLGLLYSQEYNKSFEKILELTKNEALPFETKKVNDKNITQLNEDIVLKGILNNDSNKLTYLLKYYDIDEQKNTQERTSYRFWSISKIKFSDITLFIYMKVGNDSLSILLSTYYKMKLVDNLCIGLEVGETEIIKYQESVITENLEIKSRTYEWNPEFSDKKLKENPDIPLSVVTLSDYKIDLNTGKIILTKQEKKYSKCYPEEFSYKNSNCKIYDYP